MVVFVCATSPTRTLPIVYVNTQNGQSIDDKETQIPASVYIDSVVPQFHSLGSAEKPIAATIKGRGNWTWTGFDKKPYKIKFDKKQKVLGMPGNRHWCLMACADDPLGFLKMPAGFAISEALGLRWTPRHQPVELVLNGQHMGLYFLTEHVRIASKRVNIKEQAENETQADSITGGWLVEIDNYQTANNISFTEGNGQHIMVSLKEPEELTNQQRTYLENQLLTLSEALYESSSDHLEQILDITEAAKFYLVQEIMEDCESYHGSCFLYKDRDSLGIADKWKFGPVWDFGNAYNRRQETWIYINPTFAQYWIGQLASWPVFQQRVKEQWWLFYHTYKDSVRAQLRAYADYIEMAAKRDADQWRGTSNYCDNSNYSDVRDRFFRRYDWRINWLHSQWGEGIPPEQALDEVNIDPNADSGTNADGKSPMTNKILLNGHLLILRDGKYYTPTGLPYSTDRNTIDIR